MNLHMLQQAPFFQTPLHTHQVLLMVTVDMELGHIYKQAHLELLRLIATHHSMSVTVYL
jgi:hypothetical protein